ncbi:MAG: MazG family protein, partial [Myxococcales bacterium]|nr:MazG family protein [Myxococcales bacterium]
RHPHVFADVKVSGSEDVVRNWEAIKAEEKAKKKGKGARGRLDGVPKALPALLRAVRVGEKAASVGYDWPDAGGPRAKVEEELRELDEAIADGDRGRVEAELGDVLFSLASFARKQGIDPEAALRGTLDRFSKRFAHAEGAARTSGRELDTHSPAELDALWEQAKRAE